MLILSHCLEPVGALAAVTTHVSGESGEPRASISVENCAHQDFRVSSLVLAIGVDSTLDPLDRVLCSNSFGAYTLA